MDNTGASINKSEYGRLIIHSIPTRETEEMVVSYLSRMVKNVSSQKLAQKVRRTPFVLSKNVANKTGEKIAQNLRDLGARAEFVPHDLEARGSTRISATVLASEIESLHPVFESNKPGPTKPPESESSAKRLVTGVVVIILVAVFSLLIWQLYNLLAD
jgi:hypothetical protein